jgi:hypothetical protein
MNEQQQVLPPTEREALDAYAEREIAEGLAEWIEEKIDSPTRSARQQLEHELLEAVQKAAERAGLIQNGFVRVYVDGRKPVTRLVVQSDFDLADLQTTKAWICNRFVKFLEALK